MDQSVENKDKFHDTFVEIISDLPSLLNNKLSTKEITGVTEWLKVVMIYNVPNGKQIRGRLILAAYEQLVDDPTEETLRLARILGWIGEILQASYLVADDIMDNGITRRGYPCWHRVNNKGNVAFNDSLLLEHVAYQVLRKHFSHLKSYTDLLDLILGTVFKTVLGESLDLGVAQTPNYESYTMTVYKSIVIYKTAYYTMFLPIALAMTLAGMSSQHEENKQIWEKVEEITLKMGELYQIQDDYLDCFGDNGVLGKMGTDIQEKKCTWLFVTAKELCRGDEYEVLKKHYGSQDKGDVAIVKQLFEKLGLPNAFEKCQENLQDDIEELIETVDHTRLRLILCVAMKKICYRAC